MPNPERPLSAAVLKPHTTGFHVAEATGLRGLCGVGPWRESDLCTGRPHEASHRSGIPRYLGRVGAEVSYRERERERETWYDMIMSDFSDLKGRTVTCRAVQPRRRKVDHPLRQKPTGRAAEHPLARQFGVSCRDLGCFFIVFLL